MIDKKVSVLLGISLMLPSSFLIADTAFDRALGKGVTQNYQGLDRSGREVYPGVWSQGREERSVVREEVYPGVWRTQEVSSGYEGDIRRNSSGSGITIVNRATGRSGDFNVQDREQDRNFQSTSTRSSQQQVSSPSTGSQPTSNQRASSSYSGFTGISASNTRTPSISGVTEREREYTSISSLIDPDFD